MCEKLREKIREKLREKLGERLSYSSKNERPRKTPQPFRSYYRYLAIRACSTYRTQIVEQSRS